MILATKSFFQTNKNNTDQRQVIKAVLGILVTLLALGGTFALLPKRDIANSSSPMVVAELPPYWAWLEADGSDHPQARDAERSVYAYSVIPGGVRNSKELKLALAHDPVAASHYTGFRAEAARPTRLDRARQVYVSYRLGSHIYWTSKKVTLRAGETLLSDGSHLVRGRCGNRISEIRLGPTSSAEPAEPALNAPVLPKERVETSELPAPPPIWSDHPSPIILAMAPISAEPTPGNGPFLPPLPVVPCCGGGGRNPSPPVVPPGPPTPPSPPEPPSPPQPPPPPNTPPVSTPEPSALELLFAGLAGAGAIAILKIRRR